MSESQSVPEEDSFATIIIFAHGADVRSHRATTEQHETLRKFTLAGKSGHLSYAVQDVMDSMFYLAHPCQIGACAIYRKIKIYEN